MYETNALLRFTDPNSLCPGMRIYDRSTGREGEIIKIEYEGRGLPTILIVFDRSDTPCNSADYKDLVLI